MVSRARTHARANIVPVCPLHRTCHCCAVHITVKYQTCQCCPVHVTVIMMPMQVDITTLAHYHIGGQHDHHYCRHTMRSKPRCSCVAYVAFNIYSSADRCLGCEFAGAQPFAMQALHYFRSCSCLVTGQLSRAASLVTATDVGHLQ